MKDNKHPLESENPLGEWNVAGTLKTAKKRKRISLAGTKPRKPRNEIESRSQIAFFVWARHTSTLKKYPLFNKLLFSTPNGGFRSPRTGAQMKAEGSERGVSDILFLVPAHGFHYLALEFKAPKGRQSEHQKDFESEVNKVGGIYKICYSNEEAKKIVAWYYSGIQ